MLCIEDALQAIKEERAQWKKDLTPQWEDHKKRFDVIETKVVTEIEPAVLDLIEKSKNAIDAEELEKKLKWQNAI